MPELGDHTELVILDMGSTFGNKNSKIIEKLDGLIFVTTPDLPCVADTLKSMQMIEQKMETNNIIFLQIIT